MIKKIIHIADVHIPNSNEKRPYGEMLNVLVDEIEKAIGETERDSVRIAIAGDTFHNKIRTTNEAKSMFHAFLNRLNRTAKTIIIAGNHDMLENNNDRVDSIRPTFEIDAAYSNITYLDKELDFQSGTYEDENVVWALYSMYDKFRRPEFNSDELKLSGKRIIGLYHGELKGATTDLGAKFDSGIPISDFDGCDCVMCGHIHKHQTVEYKIPVVYSGSTFQMDVGEKIEGHGFVVWDMEDMSYIHVEVPNDYRMLKFKISSYDDIANNLEELKR